MRENNIYHNKVTKGSGKTMAMEHFKKFLNNYGEKYYTTYVHGLYEIGDYLCGIDDSQLSQWIQSTKLHPHPYRRRNGNTFKNTDEVELPPYAQALQCFFYKHYDYPDQRYLPEERNRVTELEQELATIAHAGRSTIASWKSGSRVPDKYKWWALGISVFELNFWDVQPYLDMINCQVNMTCLDDVLLFYSICSVKTMHEVYCLLEDYSCTDTMQCFKQPEA